jgi:hypothetical protein
MLENFPEEPKGMHSRTYERLRRTYARVAGSLSTPFGGSSVSGRRP